MIDIQYAQIRECDVSNGEGIGIALFVEGCHFHCPNCFNLETWAFDNGEEWTLKVKKKFFDLADRPYIKRISILGGESLAEENLNDVLNLVTEINKRYNTPRHIVSNNQDNHNILIDNANEIRISRPRKSIWIYTGYQWEHIFDSKWHYNPKIQEKLSTGRWRR